MGAWVTVKGEEKKTLEFTWVCSVTYMGFGWDRHLTGVDDYLGVYCHVIGVNG